MHATESYEWAVLDEDGSVLDRYDSLAEAEAELAEYPAGCRTAHVPNPAVMA